jgi:hypothetical protein
MKTMAARDQAHSGLPEDAKALLEFERAHWGLLRNKESAVRESFGVSLARYYQRLYAVCELPEALAYDAVFVRQCQEAADVRFSSRRLGKESADG